MILEFAHVGSQVFLVQISILQGVQHGKSSDCVKVLHLFEFTLLYFDLDVIVNFFLKQSTELKLNV